MLMLLLMLILVIRPLIQRVFILHSQRKVLLEHKEFKIVFGSKFWCYQQGKGLKYIYGTMGTVAPASQGDIM